MSTEHDPDHVLDASGLICPEPVLRARQALRSLGANEVLEVVATDPHSELDFEVFCARSGHELLQVLREEGRWRFRIRRRSFLSFSTIGRRHRRDLLATLRRCFTSRQCSSRSSVRVL